MTISERILKVLKDRNMTQVEFAKQVGIATSTISEWKKKKTNPTADKIMYYRLPRSSFLPERELKTRKRLLRQARRVGLHLMTFN